MKWFLKPQNVRGFSQLKYKNNQIWYYKVLMSFQQYSYCICRKLTDNGKKVVQWKHENCSS